MHKFIGVLVLVFTVVSCSPKKDTLSQNSKLATETTDAYFIGDYILRAKADLIVNAMPTTDGTKRKPYLILELIESQGQNIQDVLGLSSISVKAGGKRMDYVLTEMLDFGSDSPTLQAIVRDLEVDSADELTLYFIDFTTETTHHIIIKKVDTTVAY